MIKELTELVTLTEQTLPRPEDALDFFSGGNRDVIRLFHAIRSNNFRTEADAIQKAQVGERTKFRQIAKELLRCLEQMVLHVGYEREMLDPFNHGRFRGLQLTAITKSLASQSCKNASKKVAEELLKIGIHYGWPEFVLEASKALMNFVCVSGDTVGEYEIHRERFETYAQWRLLEERAVIYFDWVTLFYAKKKAFQRDKAEMAQRFLEELSPWVGIIPSHNFHTAYYLLDSMRYQIEADYRSAAVSNDAAIRFFSCREYPCEATLRIFYYHGIINCVYLGQYEKGELYLKNALNQASPGNNHWFNTLEIGFYLKMHNGDYRAAAELHAAAVGHKRFHVLRDSQRESWYILGAYLYIVFQLSAQPCPEGTVRPVKSSRFRNDIKDFAHDKTGMNIAILAAEVLLVFVEGKEDELWDRIAALEKYRERYLRNSEDTHRSQLFIKILVILSKYNYDGDKFLDKARPYLEELRIAPLQLTNQAHELEIVPYERLVRMLAETLVRRRGKTVGPAFALKLERAVGGI